MDNDNLNMLLSRILEDLTLRSLVGGGHRLFAPTVVRFRKGNPGAWFLMNRASDGWSESVRLYASLINLSEDWKIRFVAIGEDDFSPFITVEPAD